MRCICYVTKQAIRFQIKDQITYYEHDNVGRVTTIGTKNSAGTKTPLETYTYHAAFGETTHTVLGSTNAPDFVEIVYVDNMGNTIHTGRRLGNTDYLDTYAYDYLGNCVVYKSAYTASVGGSYTEKYTYDYAGNLLTTTDASVQEISDRLGFSSGSYFRKVLRSYTGKTPGQIRKHAAKV